MFPTKVIESGDQKIYKLHFLQTVVKKENKKKKKNFLRLLASHGSGCDEPCSQ